MWSRAFALLAPPLLLWWLALLPGGMSVDSFSSWGQVLGEPWNNHHPAPFTALLWLTSLGGLTPATSSLFHVLLMAACLAALVAALQDRLAAGPAVPLAALALLVGPFLGPFATVLWKDIPELALLLLLAGLLLRVPSAGSASRGALIAVGGVALAIALLRWNGGATDVVAGLVLLLSGRRSPRASVGMVLAVAGVAGFLVLRLIPVVLPVAPVNAVDASAQQLTELAQYVHTERQVLTSKQVEVLERVAPIQEWSVAGKQGCITVNKTIYKLIDDRGREAVAGANMAALKQVWLQVTLTHPLGFVRARLCRTKLAWDPVDPPRAPAILTVYPQVAPNPFGLHQQAPDWLRRPAASYAATSDWRWVQNLAWRPAGWLVLLLALARLVRRRDPGAPGIVDLGVLPVAVLVSFAMFPATQDARYTYPAVVLCQLGVVACLARLLRKGSEHRADAGHLAQREDKGLGS